MKTVLPLRHNHLSIRLFALLLTVLICCACSNSKIMISLEKDELDWLGEKIFQNECNRKTECLTSWNSGEDFPSLGIGHFIWYQQGQVSPFEETFPDLLVYMDSQGAEIPYWLKGPNPDSPWTDRDQFLSASEHTRQTELRNFLAETKTLQAGFIVNRFRTTITEITQSSKDVPEDMLVRKVNSLANFNPPQGLFAMIDYMHFKGSGLAASERYNDQGWGLLQVLEQMQITDRPLDAFVASARNVLTNRVSNASTGRNEQQWLQGWHNRLDGYHQAPAIQDNGL